MDSASPEFTRAWQLYFKQRGGIGPTLPGEVLPVVVMDDNSKGPYPAHRIWHWGGNITPGAGNFGYLGVRNADNPATSKSVVVIDRIFVQQITAGAIDWMYAFTAPSGAVTLATGDAADANMEADQAPSIEPRIGNVRFGAGQSANAYGNTLFPGAGLDIIQEIPGPFILGAGQQWVISPNVFAIGAFLWVRGRYYGGA